MSRPGHESPYRFVKGTLREAIMHLRGAARAAEVRGDDAGVAMRALHIAMWETSLPLATLINEDTLSSSVEIATMLWAAGETADSVRAAGLAVLRAHNIDAQSIPPYAPGDRFGFLEGPAREVLAYDRGIAHARWCQGEDPANLTPHDFLHVLLEENPDGLDGYFDTARVRDYCILSCTPTGARRPMCKKWPEKLPRT